MKIPFRRKCAVDGESFSSRLELECRLRNNAKKESVVASQLESMPEGVDGV